MKKVIEINGHKVEFKVWNGKKVYVSVPTKRQGWNTIGEFDITRGIFTEAKGKGMMQWAKYNLDLTEAQIVEICKEVANA